MLQADNLFSKNKSEHNPIFTYRLIPQLSNVKNFYWKKKKKELYIHLDKRYIENRKMKKCSQCEQRMMEARYTLGDSQSGNTYSLCCHECLITMINRLGFSDSPCSTPCYADSICDSCAIRSGGAIPDTRVPDRWCDECSICGTIAYCTSKGDWTWREVGYETWWEKTKNGKTCLIKLLLRCSVV